VPNQEKITAVAEITDRFRSSSAAVLTEYRGLTMAQLTQLRRSLGTHTTYAVVKNTLTKLAAAEAGYPISADLLTGPTAIAFVSGDPVEAARGLRDFARTNPLLVIKGGVVEGKALSAEEMRRLADLESREVLLAQIAGLVQAPLAQVAGLAQEALAQVARLAAALEEQRTSTEAAPAAAEPSAEPATE
jgi:large subunit ribosomal protein L10